MTDRKRKHETKARQTLRNAKRSGYRVYPAHRDYDVETFVADSLGNGNYIATARRITD